MINLYLCVPTLKKRRVFSEKADSDWVYWVISFVRGGGGGGGTEDHWVFYSRLSLIEDVTTPTKRGILAAPLLIGTVTPQRKYSGASVVAKF